MEKLFTANLLVKGEQVAFEATFSNEQYHFKPVDDQQDKAFAIKREADEWHEVDPIPEDVKRQAIDALDNYLLAQH
ncbi:MAG TPA: hypothetical protein VM935_06025 [Chitinophagaceae bacterium]|jgi:hypothetical protein|nr:hypothetical protein [Chitinophagaceae bacterium]